MRGCSKGVQIAQSESSSSALLHLSQNAPINQPDAPILGSFGCKRLRQAQARIPRVFGPRLNIAYRDFLHISIVPDFHEFAADIPDLDACFDCQSIFFGLLLLFRGLDLHERVLFALLARGTPWANLSVTAVHRHHPLTTSNGFLLGFDHPSMGGWILSRPIIRPCFSNVVIRAAIDSSIKASLFNFSNFSDFNGVHDF